MDIEPILMRDDVIALEVRIKDAKISVEDFCGAAGVNRATWQRWKSGESLPLMRTWMRVERAAGVLLANSEAAP